MSSNAAHLAPVANQTTLVDGTQFPMSALDGLMSSLLSYVAQAVRQYMILVTGYMSNTQRQANSI